MSRIGYIAQPASRTTLQAIELIVQTNEISSIDVAAAYITSGGADRLLSSLSGAMGDAWATVEKRWLTSFDYLRTEPVALRALMEAPTSSVRVHDAERCIATAGVPRTPFHPKAFLLSGPVCEYAIAGSGNISRSGLSIGIEAGLFVGGPRDARGDQGCRESIDAIRAWSTALWQGAMPLDAALLESYAGVFETRENLRNPVPTEDDVATTDARQGGLSSDDLRRLRVCRHLWIEAGNISRNRGPDAPGNQLMMKRLSRVYFGFPPDDVPRNSPIGDVIIQYRDLPIECSMTFSDNGMDKLVLPIPGTEGPLQYDNENLLFEQRSPRHFRLSVGTGAEKTAWRRRSAAGSGAFRMSSGREWGVF